MDTDEVSPPSTGIRVLLVEDYPANILVATTMLGFLGCDYEVATTGKEALAKIKAHHFDYILMDVQMPEMDGYEATRRLREWEAETGRPRHHVIGITAHALKGDRQKCLDAGMDDYLSKPFYKEALEERLVRKAS